MTDPAQTGDAQLRAGARRARVIVQRLESGGARSKSRLRCGSAVKSWLPSARPGWTAPRRRSKPLERGMEAAAEQA